MRNTYRPFLAFIGFLFLLQHVIYSMPNQDLTLCTPQDPDFDSFYYEEHIPRCKRNVSDRTKLKIALKYGISEKEYKNYHYDHIVSLCAGGSNVESNLQPRLPKEKLEKDKVEWEICREMRRGELKQKEAIDILRGLALEAP